MKDYIKKLRKRDLELDSYWGTNCPPVEMIAADGKKRKIKAATCLNEARFIAASEGDADTITAAVGYLEN